MLEPAYCAACHSLAVTHELQHFAEIQAPYGAVTGREMALQSIDSPGPSSSGRVREEDSVQRSPQGRSPEAHRLVYLAQESLLASDLALCVQRA